MLRCESHLRRVSSFCNAILVAIAFAAPFGGVFAEEPALIHFPADAASISILESAQYRFESPDQNSQSHAEAERSVLITPADFSNRYQSPDWQETLYPHQSFGTGPAALWLRFQIDLQPTEGSRNQQTRRFYLTQQYAWLDRMVVLHQPPDGSISRTSGGDHIPYAKRRPPHRLPVFALELSPGRNRFLVRVTSQSEKLLGLKLEDLEYPGGDGNPLSSVHLLFFSLACVAAFVTILLAGVVRDSVALYYLGYLTTLSASLAVWEGYGHRFLYPHNPEWNDPTALALAALFLYFVLQFWRRLLLMPLQFPGLDRIFGVFAWVVLAAVPLMYLPIGTLGLLETIDSLLVIGVVLLVGWSGVAAICQRFTPAYLSVIGVLFFMAGLSIFSFSGVWIFPGNDYTRASMYLAYVVEFSLFLASIVVRLRLLSQVASQATGPATLETKPVSGINAPAKSNSGTLSSEPTHTHSRLHGNDIRVLSAQLIRLLEEDRLYADEDLNQERLGQILALSRHQMTELFQLTYGANYYEVINRIRIQEAQSLILCEPERTVLSIAGAVGYSSKSSFNTEFRKRTGVSPTEFRAR